MGKENHLGQLSALLDFYSDRAVAHASFLVATVFGLFAILQLVSKGFSDFVFIMYWSVFMAGLYCLLNFGYYAGLAETTKNKLLAPTISKKDGIKESVIIQITLQRWRNTLIRRVFIRSKPAPRESRITLGESGKARKLRADDFFVLCYLLVGFTTSYVFFPISTFKSLWRLIVYVPSVIVIISEIISIVRAGSPNPFEL